MGYFGGHALSNSLDTILDVAKIINDSRIIFVLVGNGVEKDRLLCRKKQEQIENVYFLNQINKQSIPDLVHHFDCSIMIGKTSPLYRFGICPNKMYDSMMAGVPIICVVTAPKTLVQEYNCGIQISSDNNSIDIINVIIKLANMSLEARKMLGQNGRKAILQNFTYKKLANSFLQVMAQD